MLLLKSSCICIQCFKSVGPSSQSTGTIFGLFWGGPDIKKQNKQKWVWSYICTQNIPLIILILNLYGYMGLTP